MKIRSLFIIWVCVAFLSAFAAQAADKTEVTNDDQVVASFEREMSREAARPATVTRDDVDTDVLYEEISKPLQTPVNAADADEEPSS